MAAESGARTTVPKVHAEKAKLAAIVAQTRLDQQLAQIKAQGDLAKARMKAQSSFAGFAGQQLDAQAQAQADSEAANSQPMEIQAAPLPDASQPSANIAGGQGIDFNSLITPQGVQGGGAIQAATGGMGRAEQPNPAALQGAVSPYNVRQSTVNRTVPVQYGGTSENPYGGTSMVPQSATETTVESNNLSPYQLGQLQDAAVQREITINTARTKAVEDLVTQRGTGFGNLLYNAKRMSPEQFINARDELLGDLPPEIQDAVWRRGVAIRQEVERTESGLNARDENEAEKIASMISLRDQYPKGSPNYELINSRIGGNQNGLTVTLPDGTVVSQGQVPGGFKWMADPKNAREQSKIMSSGRASNAIDNLIGLIEKNPMLVGPQATFSDVITGFLDSGQDVFGAGFVPAAEKTLGSMLETGRIAPEDRETVSSKGIEAFYDPQGKGQAEALYSTLAILVADSTVTSEIGVRTIETVKKDIIRLRGLRGSKTIISGLRQLQHHLLESQVASEYILRNRGIERSEKGKNNGFVTYEDIRDEVANRRQGSGGDKPAGTAENPMSWEDFQGKQ